MHSLAATEASLTRLLLLICLHQTWANALWNGSHSVSRTWDACSQGGHNIDPSESKITAFVPIPCTSLASLDSGYCGNEQFTWKSDADSALASQGVNLTEYDHVICKLLPWDGQAIVMHSLTSLFFQFDRLKIKHCPRR